ncbi:hypothetical protein CkaCkLH20_07691 [Colletotrichum karsti]|uniref:T6SS Phospholipase effector Tle1-like catalytic domain-containing protein n=1 Tax=Colletotrichum karsti TaxID=1095194 RepID=A0A9P6LJW3_9PEZI|nr:uncharacterized protein CkaCkLH20_07691 [Colletotrichum karsti]KAF9874997.1 hypothetical protein CkaCkLH20_07691 [Colletotrichum karsti]
MAPSAFTNGNPNADEPVRTHDSEGKRTPRKLVLCFDGTGNTFTGSNADTNVVKLLSKLDRNDPDQFHYYQTGIGTYDIDETSVNKSWFGEMKSSVTMTIDQGVGTTFDAHVLAGYRFLMRYYSSGDKIYMFGFSRGAFTAKFLARMIHTVGLLCKGNEEMVPFAYKLYQRYLAGEVADFVTSHPKKSKRNKEAKRAAKRAAAEAEAIANGTQPMTAEHTDSKGNKHSHRYDVALNEIAAFADTFCRKEMVDHHGVLEEANIKVHFLGIWDCVNSVAILERKAPIPVPVVGTAQHVRHAVAVDERRVKFKAALLAQDVVEDEHNHDDVKEVWFPGCHGDVGGGWPASDSNALDNAEEVSMGWWGWVKNFWTTRKAKETAMGCDRLQLSDVALAWMIDEVEDVGRQDPSAALKWRENLHVFKHHFADKKKQAMKGPIHDSLAFNTGTGFFTVLLWKLMEWLPFITRWELDEKGEWEDIRFPLNKGETRDIPPSAVLHESLLWRLANDDKYHPKNNHGGNEKANTCLKHINHQKKLTHVAKCDPPHDHHEVHKDCTHRTFTILQPAHTVAKSGALN